MKPQSHLTVSTLLAALFYPLIGWNALWVFMTGFLVDLDHFIYYYAIKRDLSIKGFFEFFGPENQEFHQGCMCIFHSFEILVIFIVASFFSMVIFAATASLAIHYLMDYIYEKGISGEGYVKSMSHIAYAKRKRMKQNQKK